MSTTNIILIIVSVIIIIGYIIWGEIKCFLCPPKKNIEDGSKEELDRLKTLKDKNEIETELKGIEERLERAYDENNIEEDKYFSFNASNLYDKDNKIFNKTVLPTRQKVSLLEFKESLLTPVEYESIPDYGDKFTKKKWLSCVKSGGFIDYDGEGYYATRTKMSNKLVKPSHVKKGWFRDEKRFTHIIWFNR